MNFVLVWFFSNREFNGSFPNQSHTDVLYGSFLILFYIYISPVPFHKSNFDCNLTVSVSEKKSKYLYYMDWEEWVITFSLSKFRSIHFSFSLILFLVFTLTHSVVNICFFPVYDRCSEINHTRSKIIRNNNYKRIKQDNGDYA